MFAPSAVTLTPDIWAIKMGKPIAESASPFKAKKQNREGSE